MEVLKKILFILTPRERRKAYLLFFMILIMALLDTIGVASILPFMAVLTNPSIVESNLILNNMFKYFNAFGIIDNQDFFVILGVLVFLILIISLIFKALTTYAQIRFSEMRQFTIGKRMVEGYLQKSYDWSLNQNSSKIGTSILSEVGVVVTLGINEFTQLLAKGSIVILIIFLLILVDPILTLVVGLTICSIYGLIFYMFYGFINKVGIKRLASNELRYKIISEVFTARKEVKVSGLEQIYLKRFSNAAEDYARTSSSVEVLRQLPRYFLEMIIFGGVLLIVLYLMKIKGNFNDTLPILSLYVFAGYRLMPAINQFYASVTQIRFIGPSLDKLYNEFKYLKPFDLAQDNKILPFDKSIKLSKVCYNYPNSSSAALKNIDLTIPAKSTVGFIGSTGSGKTTTIDIILGLLDPQKGTLQVDEKVITKQNCRHWQKNIGYVPQHIYLSDDSVAANIAFGVEPKDRNYKALEIAAKIANLHQFVVEELSEKYDTIIGEHGIRLSGGQRQRIGIARALYHNPKVLILDEATNALDSQTEQVVMEAINNLSKNITIILIAHRLNTVKNCDQIFKIDKGEVVEINKNQLDS